MAKLDKAEVDYRPGKGMQRCKLCVHFRPDSTVAGTCEIVAGRIRADYLCRRFKKARQ